MHNWNIRTLLDFVFGAYCNFFGRPTESRFRFEYYIKFFVLANKFRHDILYFFVWTSFAFMREKILALEGKQTRHIIWLSSIHFHVPLSTRLIVSGVLVI